MSIRTSVEDRKKLLGCGPLSETMKQALDLCIKMRKSRESVQKLAQFQKENPVWVDPDKIVNDSGREEGLRGK